MRYDKLSGNYQKESLMLLAAQVSHSVWLEDASQIIASLSKLANYALDTGYVSERNLIDWLDVVSIDAGINVLFDIVEECAAGLTDSYSELYYLCTQLTCKILNGNTDHVFTQEMPIKHDRFAADWS